MKGHFRFVLKRLGQKSFLFRQQIAMAYRRDKLNNYLVVCHLSVNDIHITFNELMMLGIKTVEANLFKVTMTDDIRPTRAAHENNSRTTSSNL